MVSLTDSFSYSYMQIKWSHECWRLKSFISTVIYPAIRSYDEQVFDNMSEESEKKNFVVKKSLQPVPSQGMVKKAK